MNTGTLVKVEVDAFGADLRLWIDDEQGHHLAVAEVRLSARAVSQIAAELDKATQDAAQLLLWGD